MILTIECKNKARMEKLLAKMKDRVLYTLEIHYKDDILGYVIAYVPKR